MTTYEDGDKTIFVVIPRQRTVAETVIITRALRNGDGFAPRKSAIGAAVAHNVNVFRKVGFVVLALVGDRYDAAILRRNDGRNAIIR